MNSPITNEFAEDVTNALAAQLGIDRGLISFEIQDDYQFLLTSVCADNVQDIQLSAISKAAAEILNRTIPRRRGKYSWMVNFTRSGKVVESFFGGDTESPNSGLW